MKEYKPGDYYEFDSNEKTIVSRVDKNGYEDQYFHKEEVKFKVLYKDLEAKKMLVIADKPTEQELTLRGKAGYDNGVEELHRICREITGIEEARSLTREDIEKSRYWEDESGVKAKLIFGDNDNYYNWIATQTEGYWSECKFFRMFFVGSGRVSADSLYRSNGSASSSSYAVRPVIEVDI